MEAFAAVAELAAGRLDAAHDAVSRLERLASADGYDRYTLNWAGWMLGLATRTPHTARRWMDAQVEFLTRTGVGETWLAVLSAALCDVIDDADHLTTLGRALALAEREGYDARADCLLVLAFAEQCAGRHERAAELVGTALLEQFNATSHYPLYRAVIDRPLRDELAPAPLAAAMARGRSRTAAEQLAAHGVAGPARAR
jgi:hypothetical protein